MNVGLGLEMSTASPIICGRYLWALSVGVEQFIEAPSAPTRYNS